MTRFLKLKAALLITLSTTLLSASLSEAYLVPGYGGGRRPGDGQQPPPYNPPSRPPNRPDNGYNQQRETKYVYIGRSVYNESLPLRQLAGLGQQYQGWSVTNVRARTTPNSSTRTTVQLLADQRVVAQQVNPGYQINLYPQYEVILGSTAQRLQLFISGSTYIDTLEIDVVRGGNNGGGGYPNNPGYPNQPGYPNELIQLNINASLGQQGLVDLNAYINQNQYRGRKIERIEVTARALGQTSKVDVIVAVYNAGTLQFTNGYSQTQTFFANQDATIGQQALCLAARGSIVIETVRIYLR